MTRPMSLGALGRAIDAVAPQALHLDVRYYDAGFIVGPEATDAQIELVRTELPRTLAACVGGSVQQFDCNLNWEGGCRWIKLQRKLLPGVRIEVGELLIDELLVSKVFTLFERLVAPKYQGAVYGKMNARKVPSGMIALKLVRRTGRWRINLRDISFRFAGVIYWPSIDCDDLQFTIPGDTPNERILEIAEQVAAYLELYFPSFISLEDPSCDLLSDTLASLSVRRQYRFWIEFDEEQARRHG